MSYVRCVCGAVYNTVGTTTGMSGCCPKCGLHHSGQYRVAKPILKPSPLAAKPIEEEGRMSGNLVENGKEYPTECHHDDSTLSTLRTVYTTHEGVVLTLWMVECRVCHRITAPYLTQGEAWQRALRGWWK